MVSSSLQAEHFVHLRTFLLTLLIVSWQYPSAKLFTDCTSESIELGFSLKIMIFFFVALIDGMVPIFHVFLDASGHFTSMNSACYLSLLQNTVWPKLWYAATRCSLWWMQDGAPTYWTNSYPLFIRISQWEVSRLSHQPKDSLVNPWPTNSTHFNLFASYFLDGCAKLGFPSKNLTRSTRWCNVWKYLSMMHTLRYVSRFKI